MASKKESTTAADVAQARPTRLGTFLRNTPPISGSMIQDDYTDLLDFMVELNFDACEVEDLENLDRLYSDIEYMGRTTPLDEGILRAKKVSGAKLQYSRRWYNKNRSKLKKARKKLAKSAEGKKREKKKEIMAKQRKNRFGKPLRKYPTAKGHTNERVSFAEMVEPISKMHSVKEDYQFGKKDYLIAEDDFQINEMPLKKNQVFVLTGTKLIFEYQNKKYKIDDATPVLQHLTRV